MNTFPRPGARSGVLAILALACMAALAGCGGQGSGKGGAAGSADAIPVTLKDHKFSPAEIVVPSGKPAVIRLANTDPLAEEFDSSSLGVEKVVAGGQSGLVRLHPLAPGRYPFMGEYHSATAQGVVVAK